MANNYVESSSFLNIPREKLGIAQNIVNRVVQELEDSEEGYCGCSAEIEGIVGPDGSGVWFHGVESTNVEHVEMIARALIEELEIDEPFFCSWAFTCSKPRIDEFGGGAFVMKRGYQTYWCDARNHVEQQLEDGGMIPLADASRDHQQPLASGVSPVREAESAGAMPEVPKGRLFGASPCSHVSFLKVLLPREDWVLHQTETDLFVGMFTVRDAIWWERVDTSLLPEDMICSDNGKFNFVHRK